MEPKVTNVKDGLKSQCLPASSLLPQTTLLGFEWAAALETDPQSVTTATQIQSAQISDSGDMTAPTSSQINKLSVTL